MSDVKQLLERAHATAMRVVPDSDGYERFLGYRDRRRRNQRLIAGGVALGLALAVAGVAFSVLRTSEPSRIGGSGIVVDVPTDQGPCFAEDPCWDTDVFVVRTDGTQVTRLGYDEARDFAYSWSPDGERIAFYHAVGAGCCERFEANADIYTMSADGSDVRQLTDDPGLDLFPVFSPDGSKIAFTSDRTGIVEVYVMGADGGDPVPITEFDASTLDDYHPTWSPDGDRIAFVRGAVPPGGAGELWVIDADGSNPHVVIDESIASFPAWSPDGTRIAFELGDWPDVGVQVLELESGTLTDLGSGHHPVWSPDSSRLVVSFPGDEGFAILDLDRPDRRQIIHPTGWAAAWSPDGEWIVFNDAGLTAASPADEPPPGVGQALAGFRDDGTPFLVVRHEDGSLTAVEAISPHVATGGIRKLVGWCASSQTFDDPFHGSRFDGYGRYLYGPAPTGLVRFDLEVVEEIPGFRLGDALAPLPRETGGDAPAGPLCLDTDVTPLVMPDVAASGLTPADLAATAPPEGSRWLVEGTLSLEPDGTALLCAEVQATTCLAGAPVEGPSIDGGDPLVVPGRWLVLVRDGTLVDPIRTVRP